MNYKSIILPLLLVIKLALSIQVAWYYWNSSALVDLKNIPLSILVSTVAYIGLHMLTRKLSSNQNWWDWTYYIGLLSVLLPYTFANNSNQEFFLLFSDIGVLFLLFPVLIDGYFLVNKPSNAN
jgi:uncharacterized membrane protein HdeD (DUF308 family)